MTRVLLFENLFWGDEEGAVLMEALQNLITKDDAAWKELEGKCWRIR
jgi:hypothetical protein